MGFSRRIIVDMTLDDLPKILDEMVSKQKEKRAKTFVARYNGKNLIMRSGKSSWKQVNHAKSAVINHFQHEETAYKYGWPQINPPFRERGYDKFTYEERNNREDQFRAELFKLIDIVELTD